MSIIRATRPEANWYAVDKAISEDPRLGWGARGLLLYLLGKPDNWRVSVNHLRAQTEGARVRTGRDGIYALLAELQAAGYCQARRARKANGTLGPVDYIIREQPLPPEPEVEESPSISPLPAQPDTAQPDTAGTTLVKTERATKTERSKTPPPSAAPIATGLDPLKDMIDGGIAYFGECGIGNKQARSVIGQTRKHLGDDLAVAELLAIVQRDRIADPIAWLSKAVRSRTVTAGNSTYANRSQARQPGLADRHPAFVDADDGRTVIEGQAVRYHA